VKFPRLLGLLVVALGASALFGWAVGVPLHKSFFHDLIAMKADTAIGMMLAGCGLVLLARTAIDRRLRLCAAACAVATAALGTLTLAGYFSGSNFGIDELLFRDRIHFLGTSYPGRMSPSTALCFVLVGCALWVACHRAIGQSRISVLVGLSAPLIFIGLTACFGEILAKSFNFPLWNYFGMGVHTAGGFILLGSGFLTLARSEEKITWGLSKSITFGFVVSFAILVTAAGVSRDYAYQVRDTTAGVSHTQQVLRETEHVRASMTDLENSQRGYLISGDENLLTLSEQSRTEIRRGIENLRNLISDNAQQKSRLDELASLVAERGAFEEQTIAVRRQQGLAGAQRMFALGIDTVISNQINGIVEPMLTEEDSLLAVRERRAEAVYTAASMVQPMAVFISLTILSLALFFLNTGVTERESAQELSSRLAAIVNSSNDAVIGKNLNSIITSWNSGAERMFGYSAADMIGQSIMRIIPSDRQVEEIRITEQVRRGELIVPFETLRVAKDGRVVDVADTVSPIKDKKGRIVGASKIVRDITDRKRAEEALKDGEKQFQTMVNAIPQLAWIARPDGSIFWYNQRWFDFTGTTLEQVDGWGWREVLDPILLPKVLESWEQSLESGEPFEMEYSLRSADGHYGWFLTRGFPLRDNAGKIVRWFGTNTDLSQKRAAEEEIRELNITLEERVSKRTAELEAANKELESFSYSVSHDLRAPLRAVDGFSQAVLEDYGGRLPAQGRKDLETIRSGAQRMGVLIDDLLKFSKLGRTQMNKRPVNTDMLIGKVLEGLSSQREGRQIDIRIGVLPECQGDVGLLNQVWINLISNALKYTRREATAVIEIGCKLDHGENVYFVRDNGAGFNMRYVNKLFGVFQRLHRAEEFEGTGVGLAIVQRIIHRHGGRIWADAALNQGATFSFTLEGKSL
jgi:PAS domain S-box-containing protein